MRIDYEKNFIEKKLSKHKMIELKKNVIFVIRRLFTHFEIIKRLF
jgi:hypothetical protein